MAAEGGGEITQAHWISADNVSVCMEPGCERSMGAAHPPHHCYRCGLVYCAAHVARRRRLSPDAVPTASAAAALFPVCAACFAFREDAGVVVGVMVDHSQEFKAARAVRNRARVVESNKLLRRLEKLAAGPDAAPSASLAAARLSPGAASGLPSASASSPAASSASPARVLRWLKTKAGGRREFESSVVRWKPERDAAACAGCDAPFGTLARKVHCRLCGNVFCSTCAQYRVPYGILRATHNRIEVPDGAVKACHMCFELATTRYRRARLHIQVEQASATPSPLAYLRYYHAIVAERKLINGIVPEYEAVSTALATPVAPARSSDAQDARNAYRARQEERAAHLESMLATHVRKLEALGKRVAALETDSPLVAKVQRNIQLAIVVYMQALFANKSVAALSKTKPKQRF